MWSNEPIEIIMKIPFPINEPDRNGAIYTKEAIEKAVEKFDGGVPLIIVKDEVETVIGHIHSAELSENYEVTVHGEVFFGGTSDEGDVKNDIVTDFRFLSFGISV